MSGFGPYDPKAPEVVLSRCRDEAVLGYNVNMYNCMQGNLLGWDRCNQIARGEMHKQLGACYSQYYAATRDQPFYHHYYLIPTIAE